MADFKNRVKDVIEIDGEKKVLPRNFDCLRALINQY